MARSDFPPAPGAGGPAGPEAAPPGADGESLEALVTRLAPLYKERGVLQAELQKVQARLDRVRQEIAALEARLRVSTTH